MNKNKLNKVIKRTNKALAKAERMYGSANALAKKIGISRQRFSCWRSGRVLLPYDQAIKIFVTTHGKVSIGDLRLDLKPLTKEFRDLILEQPDCL